MSDQAAFQEVDDAVRQDDLTAWWKRWGTLLIVAVVVMLAAVIGLMQWRKYENGQREVAGAAYSAALARIGTDNAGARVELDKQAVSAPEPYRSLAALAAAQLLDPPGAEIAALIAVAPKLPTTELSDLAIVIAAFHSLDTDKADETIARLAPLAAPDRPFHASVLELQALAALRKGDVKKAREVWNEILKDQVVAQGAAQRAQALLNLYAEPQAVPGTK